LPKIVPSADCTIGCIHGIPSSDEGKAVLKNVIVGSVLGDQQAALFGQTCFVPGTAKCTYGTGLFLMMNTGVKPMPSTQGLLTTVAYQVGKRRIGSEESNASPPVYALEGSVAFSGSTINWLRDRLDLIKSAAETEALALSVASNDNMYLVPAFSGLFAPHWRPDARGCMVGLTASHSKAHIVRAALESSAYQAREVFDAF
jgi:glycerol kinase